MRSRRSLIFSYTQKSVPCLRRLIMFLCKNIGQQAISACERGLCQLTVCFEFQSRSDSRKGHKVVPCKWYSEGK